MMRSTYGELDVLFEQKVPARKFKTTKVDPYRIKGVEALDGEAVEQEKEQASEVEKTSQS